MAALHGHAHLVGHGRGHRLFSTVKTVSGCMLPAGPALACLPAGAGQGRETARATGRGHRLPPLQQPVACYSRAHMCFPDTCRGERLPGPQGADILCRLCSSQLHATAEPTCAFQTHAIRQRSQLLLASSVQPWLDGRHVVFGEVLEGLDVVQKIEKTKRDGQDRPREQASA